MSRYRIGWIVLSLNLLALPSNAQPSPDPPEASAKSHCTEDEIAELRLALRTLQTVSMTLLEELAAGYSEEMELAENELRSMAQQEANLANEGAEIDRQALELDRHLQTTELDDSQVEFLVSIRQQVEGDASAGIELQQQALRDQQSSTRERQNRLTLRHRELLRLRTLILRVEGEIGH